MSSPKVARSILLSAGERRNGPTGWHMGYAWNVPWLQEGTKAMRATVF